MYVLYNNTLFHYISPVKTVTTTPITTLNILWYYSNCVCEECFLVCRKHPRVLLDIKCCLQYFHEEGLCVSKPGWKSRGSLCLFHFICKGCQMEEGHADLSQGCRDAWHEIQRPIACLPTLYKLLTSCIATKFQTRCNSNNVLTDEQKGCSPEYKGCRDCSLLNCVVVK